MGVIDKIVPINRDSWVSGASYSKLDIVRHNGKVWQSKEDNNTDTPSENSPKWMFLVRDGFDGSGATWETISGKPFTSVSDDDFQIDGATKILKLKAKEDTGIKVKNISKIQLANATSVYSNVRKTTLTINSSDLPSDLNTLIGFTASNWYESEDTYSQIMSWYLDSIWNVDRTVLTVNVGTNNSTPSTKQISYIGGINIIYI